MLSSRSAKVLVIFIVAIIAFCLACVCASMNDPDKISVKKDGRSKKATYYNHIHTLFSLYQLSEAEKAIMRNLALAPRSGILAKLIAIWLELDNLNIINDLIEKGFIEARAGRTILLHPMIQEITAKAMVIKRIIVIIAHQVQIVHLRIILMWRLQQIVLRQVAVILVLHLQVVLRRLVNHHQVVKVLIKEMLKQQLMLVIKSPITFQHQGLRS